MTPIVELAARHGGDWFLHTLGSSIIHGLVYGVIYKLMRGMSLAECIGVAAIGLAIVGGLSLLRRR